MLRVLRYIKPYRLAVLVVIVLLFGQVMGELKLPNLMSDIVNVGIQQGGIESAVPEVIRKSQLDRMYLFMTADEKSTVQAAYVLLDPSNPEYSTLLKKYPGIQENETYVVKSLTTAEIDALTPITGRTILIVYGLEEASADPTKAAELSKTTGFDLSKIPAGTDVFILLRTLPQAQLDSMLSGLTSRFAGMNNKQIVQAAAAAVKAEYVALGASAQKIQTAYIIRIGAWMLLLTLGVAIAVIIISLLSARTGSGFARDVRRDVFSKVESFSKAEFETFSTASLITRSTNDITQMQMMVIMSMRMVFYAPIMGIGAIIRAVNTSPNMTWIIAAGVVAIIAMIAVVFTISLPRFKRIQALVDRLNLVTRESLSGLMVIRAFNTQKFELDRFDKANLDLTGNNLFIGRVMVILFPFMTLIMNGLSILIIWIGSHQVANATIQVGDMIAFLQYAMQVVFSFLAMSMMFIFLPRAAVSAKRIQDVLDVDPVIKDPAEPLPFDSRSRGKVEFRNVSFRYPNAEEYVLCNISFTAQPGQTTAIIGSTGSGKSTVINLIPRFFDVTEGAVLVDGRDVREVSQTELRDRIGYIPQRGVLFSGTVESNLRYADENASLSEITKATDIAQASGFISQMEGGLEASISQGGANVSGGQKQRLAIARALLKKPSIYIFDDALSALDFKTDAALRKALKSNTEKATMIIVTQRVSTIRNAEQIIVIDEGEVAGKGTHEELMESCKPYREMVSSQLTIEELTR